MSTADVGFDVVSTADVGFANQWGARWKCEHTKSSARSSHGAGNRGWLSHFIKDPYDHYGGKISIKWDSTAILNNKFGELIKESPVRAAIRAPAIQYPSSIMVWVPTLVMLTNSN